MKPIGIFVQFLKGLEGENDNRRKSFREAEGKITVEFFATPTLRDCHTLEKHHIDIFSKRSKVSLDPIACWRAHVGAHVRISSPDCFPSARFALRQTPSRRIALLFFARARDSKGGPASMLSSRGSQSFSFISFSHIETCFLLYFFSEKKGEW